MVTRHQQLKPVNSSFLGFHVMSFICSRVPSGVHVVLSRHVSAGSSGLRCLADGPFWGDPACCEQRRAGTL